MGFFLLSTRLSLRIKRVQDLACFIFILAHESSSSSLLTSCAVHALCRRLVTSSMRLRSGRNHCPALLQTPLDITLVPMRMISKVAVKRMGEMEHPISHMEGQSVLAGVGQTRMRSPGPAIQYRGPSCPSWQTGSGPKLALHVLSNLRNQGLQLSSS